MHQIVAVDNSEYLNRILENAVSGEKIEKLANLLVDDDITFEEALDFIDELINSQLLVSQLESSVTGEDFLLQLIRILSALPENKQIIQITETLKSIADDLNRLSEEKTGKPVHYYESIVEKLKTFLTKYDLKFLFQTDMSIPVEKCTVNKTVTIPFSQNMTRQAEIITEDIRLLYLIMQPIRLLFIENT